MSTVPQILRFLLETDDDEDLVKDAGYHPSIIQIDLGHNVWSNSEPVWRHYAPSAYQAIAELWGRGLQFRVESRPSQQTDGNKMDVTFVPERHAADVDMWFTWDAHDTVLRDIYGPATDEDEQVVFDEIVMELEGWMAQHNFSEDGTWHLVRTVEGSALLLSEELDQIVDKIEDMENALIADETQLADEFVRWKQQLKAERGL